MFDGHVEYRNRLVKRFEHQNLATENDMPMITWYPTYSDSKDSPPTRWDWSGTTPMTTANPVPPVFKIPQYQGFYESRRGGGPLLKCLGSATHTETEQHFVIAEEMNERPTFIAIGIEGFEIDYQPIIYDRS